MSNLRILNFDYEKNAIRLGVSLFVFGLVFFVYAVFINLEAQSYLLRIKGEVQSAEEKSAKERGHVVERYSPEQKQKYEEINKKFNFPWNKIFSILENVSIREVSLLSIQPTITQHQVLLTAQAENVHQMLEYVKALGLQEGVNRIELLRQDKGVEGAVNNVYFELIFEVSS
jgi:hypothetical protein